ncbi:hypothetical protein CTA1_13432 [Colletotrichum tanaceti]|uniref:Uncharacterized protein n=1 Tax=Colletotrichum tanaceti TaxID=1306861 RepID=A0A4U6XF20_9PEZI|nr:hypothetical protein CTA1_13432 [Colletotrichum tanaceti]
MSLTALDDRVRRRRLAVALALGVEDGALDGGGDVDVEEGPVHALHGGELAVAAAHDLRRAVRVFVVVAAAAALVRRDDVVLLLVAAAGRRDVRLVARARVDGREAVDGLPAAQVVLVLGRGEAEAGGGEGAARPAVVDVGEVPLHHLGLGVVVQLVAHIDEALDRRDVDVVDGRAVEDDGPDDGAAVVHVDLGTSARAGLLVPVEDRPAGVLLDVLDEAVHVVGLVGVVEALAEAVDKDARVGALDVDVGVRAVVLGVRDVGLARGDLDGLAVVVEGDALAGRVLGSAVDADAAEEVALGLGEAHEEEGERGAHGQVDAVLDVGEDGEQDAGEEDEDLEGRHLPELVDDLGGRDEVADGVDDEAGEGGHGDVEEDGGQGVEGQQDDDGGEDAGEGGADAGLGLDGGAGEGSGGRVGAEEGAEEVGEADGDQLLGGVDDVVVDAAEGLGDGDVLDDEDDDGDGQVRGEGGEQLGVDVGGAGVLEAAGDLAEDPELCLFGVPVDVAVDEPADEDVEQDDEGHAEGGHEEPELLAVRLAVGHDAAEEADGVEQEEGGQAHGGVDAGGGQGLEHVDDDPVGRVAGVDALQAEQGGDLAGGDADGGARHEGGDGHEGDELDDPAEADEADEEQHGARDDGQGLGDLRPAVLRVRVLHAQHDVADELRHDGDGADGDVLGRRKGPVEDEADEGGV